jgi:arylsulfatase A-like enzyme
MKRAFIKGWLLAGSLVAGAVQASQRPNIIFIFSDDHTRQAIGAYGGPLAKLNPTPNIYRLFHEGMRFEHFYVENSICAPSRATLLTGKMSHRHGKIDNSGPFNHRQQTFPKLLQQAGYQTAIFGKTHLDGDIEGFDHWEVLPGQGNYYQPEFITPSGRILEQGYVTDVITRKSLDWLKQRDVKKPFMLMIHHKGTHRNWCPALRHLNAFKEIELPTPSSFDDDYCTRTTAAHQQKLSIRDNMKLDNDLKVLTDSMRRQRQKKYAGQKNLPSGDSGSYFRMTPEQRAVWDAAYELENQAFLADKPNGEVLAEWKYQRYLKDYLRTALSIDESVGQVLDYLKANGLDENTVVMYSSDQGFYLGEHGWFDKRFMYQESFSAPLLVRWPDEVCAGSVNSDLCQNIDFAETFLELAGIPVPADMQGRSLLPLFRGRTPDDWRSSLYYHYYEYPGPHSVRRHEGVFDKRFKLIRFYGQDVPDGEEWEFYDLKNDPGELLNMCGNPEYQERVLLLKQELNRLKAAYQIGAVFGGNLQL